VNPRPAIQSCTAGDAFAPGDEIGQRLHVGGDHRTHRQQHGRGVDGGHRREILQRVAERLVDVRVKRHGHGRRHDHDRAVGGAVLQHVHHDAAAGTGTVLDDGRGRIRLQVLGDESRGDVARTARGKADHDARRGVQGLRLRESRREAQCAGRDTARTRKQETPAIGPGHATNVCHGIPLVVSHRRVGGQRREAPCPRDVRQERRGHASLCPPYDLLLLSAACDRRACQHPPGPHISRGGCSQDRRAGRR
jgi:hypothetical protein